MQGIDPNGIRWDDAPQAPRAPAPQQPTVIGGRRVIGDVPPSERRAEQDQVLQIERDNRAAAAEAERLRLAREADDRAAIEAERGGVEQGKSASFLKRAINAETSFRKLGEVQPRSYPGQVLASAQPDLVNNFSDESRQLAEQSEREFIAAVLRYDSGAAIPPEEFLTQGRIYFPRAGDTDAVLAQKARSRRVAIEGLKASAGPLGEREAIPDFEALVAQEEDQDTLGVGLGGEAAQGYGDDGRGNPLVMGDGQVLLGYESDAPQYGPVGQNKNIDPRALELYKRIQSEQKNLGEGGFGDVARSGVTIGLSDEAAGVGEVIGKALTGDFNVGQNFETGRALDNFRTDQGRQNVDAYAGQIGLPQGVASTATELLGAGGAVRSIGAFGQARQAVQSVRNAGAPVNRATVNNALVRRATVEGAGLGLVAGAAQGDSLQERGSNALLGIATGGAFGNLGQRAGNAISSRTAPASAQNPARAQELSQAADNVGFTRLNRAMVDEQSNNAVTKADASLVGGRVVQRDMQAAADEFGERVGANLGAGGRALDDVARGDTFKDASVRFIKETGKTAKRRYDAAESMAGNAKVEAGTSLPRATQILRGLQETPETNSEEIKFVQKIISDLGGPDGNGLTVGALRKMRTSLRKKISKGDLVFGEDEANVLAIMDAASDDIVAGLTAQGKGAAAEAFRRADTAYAARMGYIKNTIQKLVGPRQSNLNAAQVAKKVDSLSTSDYNEFRKAYAMLEPDERLDMAATMAQRLGRTSTQTNEAPFSVDTFVTNTAKMDTQALRAVFGDEGAARVQDLRLIGKEIARVRGSMNSRKSGSGVASYRDWMFSIIGTAAPVMASGGNMTATGAAAVVGAGGNAAWQGFSARALMSPNLTKWLKQTPNTTSPQAINAHFGRLDNVVRLEPGLVSEVTQFRQAVMAAANDNPSAALAAEEQPNEPN